MNPETADRPEYLRTAIGHSTPTTISLCGRDLATDVMGRMSFTHLTFLLATGHEPTAEQARMLDAVLVSLADHGFTPTALAARLTLTGAPESTQGALAAGILGAGSVFLGPAEDTARFLQELVDQTGLDSTATNAGAVGEAADSAVAAATASGLRIPGLGHPIHRDVDPRTPRLVDLAGSLGLPTVRLSLLLAIAERYRTSSGRQLPVNGAGAAGAVLADLGCSPSAIRGVVVLARAAGLLGHIMEEEREPIAYHLWQEVESRTVYTARVVSADGSDGGRP